MFCAMCGTALQAGAQFCSKCGQAASAAIVKGVAASPPPPEQNSAIWNPNAASNWSLIFSPAFGSYLHALNWRTLGEAEKEKSAMGWFYFSLFMLAVYISMGLFMEKPEEADGAARGLGFLYLFVWYFSAGRAQAKYVKEKLGPTYPRRSWGKPLLIGVLAIVGFFMLASIIGLMVRSTSA